MKQFTPNTYPNHLIPTKELLIISHEDIDKSHYIGVFVDRDKKLKDDDGYLNGGVIDLARIPGFSNNKIPNSIPEDLNIKFKPDFIKTYTAEWIEGEDGITPLNDHFEVNDRQHYFLIISDIDDYSDEYYNPPTDLSTHYVFTVRVIHKPLKANYWHFELLITSPNHKIHRADPVWRNNICSAIRARIVRKAKFEIQ
jgi:hypothetical protein